MSPAARDAASAWLVALLLTLPAGARAEDKWYEHYQGALKAISSHKWADAEKKLKAAIAAGPSPGRQVRMYGVRFIDYLPDYQLGLVYFNQQRYADALEQFTRVTATAQVAKGDPEFATFTDMKELCRIRTAAKQPDGQKESEALVRFARELMGRGSLEDARRALDSAAAKNPGGADVAAAREDLVRLETEKRMRDEQERVAKDARQKEAQRAEKEFKEALGELTALVEAEKWAAADEARRRLPADRQGRAELAELARRIERGLKASLTPTPTPTAQRASIDPAEERAAFQAFYSGDYRAGAERFAALAEKGAGQQRNRFRAYAACSQAGAALLKGASGRGEIERARQLYADAGAAAARHIARDGLVSPRIVDVLTTGSPPN